MFECEKCGSPTKAMGQMTVSVPSSMMHNFSKKNMRSKDFEVFGVLWETFDFICTNESCRHVRNGYGNYVTNLKKENDELKEQISKLLSKDIEWN